MKTIRAEKWLTWLSAIVLLSLCLVGCSLTDGEQKRVAVEFQVVPFDEAPQKLQEIVENHKKEEIKMTWEGEEGLYLIRGYGEQPTGGYSISADAVELSEDGLHVTTTLIPPQQVPAAREASYPCIILFVENTGQEVTFES